MNSRFLILVLSLYLVAHVDSASVSKKIKDENVVLKMEAREEVDDKTELVPEIETVVPDAKPEKPDEPEKNEISEVTEVQKPENPQEVEEKPSEEKPSEDPIEEKPAEEKPAEEKPDSNEIPPLEPEIKPVEPETPEPNQPEPEETPNKPEEPSKRKTITYDQRQEGELNIRADLENFMIIFVPTKKSSDVSLLDLLVRNAAKNSYKKKKDEKVQEDEFKAEPSPKFDYTQLKENSPYYSKAPPQFLNPQFGIESRSPYKVDISSTLMHQELPHDAPLPFQPQYGRTPFHPMNVPQGNFRVYRSLNDNFFDNGSEGFELPDDLEMNRDAGDAYNRLNIESIDKIDRFGDEDTELSLLGATENCGPDRKRDSYGVCQFVNSN